MRFAIALVLSFAAAPAGGDAFVVSLELPAGIDVQARRAELVALFPVLKDEASRSAISTYRQEIDRYNTNQIKGFFKEIQGICLKLNEVERAANKEWDRGNLSRNEKLEIDDRIASERRNCSDDFATSSPYYGLYYELLDLYRRKDAESIVIHSACMTRDECRNK
jgi:hypothetical protein